MHQFVHVVNVLSWYQQLLDLSPGTTCVDAAVGNPSATGAVAAADANATVAVITKQDIKNAKKAAKAAQKMAEFNKKFGGQADAVV